MCCIILCAHTFLAHSLLCVCVCLSTQAWGVTFGRFICALFVCASYGSGPFRTYRKRCTRIKRHTVCSKWTRTDDDCPSETCLFWNSTMHFIYFLKQTKTKWSQSILVKLNTNTWTYISRTTLASILSIILCIHTYIINIILLHKTKFSSNSQGF